MRLIFSGRPRTRSAIHALLIGLLCSLAILAVRGSNLFQSLELKTYDWRMRLAPSYPTDDIVMLYVDEASLKHVEEMGVGWPWPRELYSAALNFLKRGESRAVFFDIFFSEPSVYGVADDEEFAEGIESGPPSYFAVFTSADSKANSGEDEEVLSKMEVTAEGEAPDFLPRAKTFKALPIDQVMTAAHALGNVQSPPDHDGVFRRIPPAKLMGNHIIPSIALKIAYDMDDGQKLSWTSKNELKLGDKRIPLDEHSNMLLNFPSDLKSFPTYSLAEVLVAEQQIIDGEAPRIEPEIFKDKIVIIGLAAPGLFDLKPSPVAHLTPGPLMHATALTNLIHGNAITPPKTWVTVMSTIIAALIAALSLTFISRWWSIALSITALLGSIVGAGILAFFAGKWWPIVPPFAACILSSTGALARNYLTEGKTKRAIKRAFGQYIAPEVVGEIARDPENIRIGGKHANLTIFFSDIAGFTSTAEQMQPQELVEELNQYLTAVTGIILEHKGTLDKYIGDAVMAFWGAPLKIPDHAQKAVSAAIAIQKKLNEFPKFNTRIGIHTGDVVVGNIGSDLRFNYTVIGDAVNLASRLEGINKYLGTQVLISEMTYNSLGENILCRKVGRVRVKGRSEPIDIYEPFETTDDTTDNIPEHIKICENGIDLFTRGNYEDALLNFKEATRIVCDPVASFYNEFCSEVIQGKVTPPMDGVIGFDKK